jgi:hypothetical protein
VRTGSHRRDVRASALWGSGKRGSGSRSNALWGNGKRRRALLATLVLTLVVPLGASAVPGPSKYSQAVVASGVFTSASWSAASWASSSWADLSLGRASWADNAGGEAFDAGAIDEAELAAILAGTLDP